MSEETRGENYNWQVECEHLRRERESLRKLLQKCEDTSDKYHQALEFYGDKDRYSTSDIDQDEGRIAREVLKG